MKARETDEMFGARLAEARQRRGITQAELGKAVGASQRVIAYYEGEGGQPPGALLADLARALKVTSDELLGLKPTTDKPSPKTARLLKWLRNITVQPAVEHHSPPRGWHSMPE
jgi:transcriptional regulator with XRE-family HTH domain